MPTIADFRRDNGAAIDKVCAQFVAARRPMGLFGRVLSVIDAVKFKGVNDRDKSFTPSKPRVRQEQLEHSAARYVAGSDRADRNPWLLP